MKFTAIAPTIEGVFASLDEESLVLVKVKGKKHIIPAEHFLALFQQEEPPKLTTRYRSEKQQVAKALTPKVDPLDEMASKDLAALRSGEWKMRERA